MLDREFSYKELMEILYLEHIQFVIRLNLGDQHKQPRLIDADGEPIKLFILPGETVIRSECLLPGHGQSQPDRLLAQEPIQTSVDHDHPGTQTGSRDLLKSV